MISNGRLKFSVVLILTMAIIVFSGQSILVFAFKLKSGSIKNMGFIPDKYTCSGNTHRKNISPSLYWQKPPAGTKSFCIIMKDLDSPSGIFYHWTIYNIPGRNRKLIEGANKHNGKYGQGINGFGYIGYGGPCPPPGNPHRYLITIYALNKVFKLKNGLEADKLYGIIKKHILSSAYILAYFKR